MDDANNVVAMEPGVVIGYDRNTLTNTALPAGIVEVITIDASELGRRGGGRHDLSDTARSGVLNRAHGTTEP